MPRILINGRWFDPVATKSLYETDYENAILAQAEDLFPGFYCVQFKALVQSEYGNAKADLALIDHSYRFWYVVEVELDTHPLKAHVEEQVQKLAFGVYSEAHVEALAAEDLHLDRGRLTEMLLGEQPRVLVLVTLAKPNWSPTLGQYGAQVGVLELFRDDLDHVLFRVNGDQPSVLAQEIVSYCTADKTLPKALRLASPAPFAGCEKLDLLHEGESSLWRVMRVSDTAWIMPEGRSPMDLTSGARYAIVRLPTGELGIEKE
jgi:hypothetical protein